MVDKLISSKAILAAKESFECVFRSRDPFEEPVQANVSSRAILYPSNYLFQRYPEQYTAIVSGAVSVGESRAYVSETEGYAQGIEFDSPGGYHALIDFDGTSFKDLIVRTREQGYPGITEAALYSTQGTWGAITSHERHAVVGGPPEFMAVLAEQLDLEAGIQEFLADFKDAYDRFGGDSSWIPRLLRHTYGDEKASQYLANFQFGSNE